MNRFRRAYGLKEFAHIFGVSHESVKRFARTGVLKTISLGGRRLVPAFEVKRIEKEGLGMPRRRSTPKP
jgi:predicted site-specific integrase-resolvase